MNARVSFTFDGVAMEGRQGESLAAALYAAGVTGFRQTRTGETRSIFCGMGVCQDCLVSVDDKPNQRACMTKLDRPMTVQREIFGRPLPQVTTSQAPRLIDDVPEETPEILVIGAGPGGLSAAIAARRAGAQVVVVDERAAPGGQYFKQVLVEGADVAPPDPQHLEGERLIRAARDLGVEIRSNVEVWGAFGLNDLIALQAGTVRRFSPQRLIVATGSFERGVPFPGWTLPGVMTTGAAQTLWRSYRRLPGKRVLVAGNGPLNMQVASELRAGGAEIAAVAELAPLSVLRSIPAMLSMAVASPNLVLDGIRYRSRLAGVQFLYGSAVRSITQVPGGLRAELAPYPASASGQARTFEVDAVCLGYGFNPSNEILRALGCDHTYDKSRRQFTVAVDETGRTSVDGVYTLGDCTGLRGARATLNEGTVVGWAVAADLGHKPAEQPAGLAAARRDLQSNRRFQAALWRLYAAPRINLELATPETIVCRCEEVTCGRIEAALSVGRPAIGELKRATRAGMGPCQGRYCGVILSELVAARQGRNLDEQIRFAPRMPVKPVSIADIARRQSP